MTRQLMEEGFKEWLLRDGFYPSMVLLNMDLLRKIFLGMILFSMILTSLFLFSIVLPNKDLLSMVFLRI